jgi:phage-related protein/predicted XRE-type DNA-binding protein
MGRNARPVSWIRAARKAFEVFPEGAQRAMAQALTILAEGLMPDIARPLTGLGSGVMQLALKHRGEAYRLVYALQIDDDIWVVHAFQKKSKSGIGTPKAEIDDRGTPEAAEREAGMSGEDEDLVRGSGNVFRDPGHRDADREQLRALLAASIIGVLDARGLGVRAAQERTGFAAADFSRIRNARLERFTIDRLMAILAALGQEVEVTVRARPRRGEDGAAGVPAG